MIVSLLDTPIPYVSVPGLQPQSTLDAMKDVRSRIRCSNVPNTITGFAVEVTDALSPITSEVSDNVYTDFSKPVYKNKNDIMHIYPSTPIYNRDIQPATLSVVSFERFVDKLLDINQQLPSSSSPSPAPPPTAPPPQQQQLRFIACYFQAAFFTPRL
ncbi:hypothetical protein BDB00DRAFT_873745 [Zychaea mexicana]|uniref:uncharacterized protein n=1 Tax=Zychaea mexicana TaxID=64656 RepID=UPI0022FF2454|nr:uncharacterized protein BDB00DRAFT_873745 [Zychaea mexicana]KAI9492106.1 hypothetical protein BDB00DRAFT_873745 [Zychaea mexicana]